MKTKPLNTCRWLDDDPCTGNPMLLINGVPYELEQVLGGYRLHHLDQRTFELVTYNIEVLWLGSWRCDCPDARHRDAHNCKHCKAVKAALKARAF